MATSIDNQEKRLAELSREVMKRGFDRHASILKNLSELPAELQSPVVSELAAREPIQTIIAFPQQIQRGWHYVPKQALLFTAAGVTHLLASIWQDQAPQVTYLKGCGLMYMKVTLLLLYGFLESWHKARILQSDLAWNSIRCPGIACRHCCNSDDKRRKLHP